MAPRTKEWVINFSVLLGTLLIFFGGIELALRVTGIEKGKPYPPPIFQSSRNPDISYELKPNIREKAYRNIVTTEEHGFRSPALSPSKKTIALLGDSITFGYGVADDETLAAQMSKELNNTYNVLNTGVPGYTLGQELATYKEKVKKMNPSALVLIFYWNDLNDMRPGKLDTEGNIRGPDWKESGIRCNPITTGILGLVPGKCWLDTHSAFYRTVKKFISARTEHKNLKEQEVAAKKTAFTENIPEERFEAYKTQLHALSQELPPGMPRLFVMWPEKELHFIMRSRLKAAAEAEGFRVMDLYQVFGNRAETLSWDTVHPSSGTLAEAATVIVAAMQEWKLLP
jgi:lysophospholipase L1-like esterase